MKQFIATTLIASSVFIALGAQAAVDYNRGFCVAEGAELVKGNAVLVVTGQYHGRTEQFFAPYSAAQSLSGFDWGGNMYLVRTGVAGRVILATYENHMHGHDVPRMNVHCIAEEI